MNREQYRKYLRSASWLKKKAELVVSVVLRGGNVRCANCDSADNLDVHHKNYHHVGDELLDELAFLCRDCHETVHNKTSNKTSELTLEEIEYFIKIFRDDGKK